MAKERARQAIENRFLAGTLVFTAILAFLVLHEYLYWIVGGALLVFAFFGMHKRIEGKIGKGIISTTISFIIVAAAVLGPILFLGYYVFLDANAFAKSYDPGKLNQTVAEFLTPPGQEVDQSGNLSKARPGQFALWLGDKLQGFAQELGSELGAQVPHIMVGIIIAAFVIFYGFIDGEAFYRKVRLAIPLPDHVEDSIFSEIRRVTSVVFVGNILIAAAGGLFGALTFLVLGVPQAMFWGFIMIILGILPFVGAPLVWLPAAAWLYTNGHPTKALLMVGLNMVFVVIYLDHILRPKLIGRVARIHPAVVLIGVLGGVETFGILGFVIGPLALALFIAVIRSYTEWHPYWAERRARGEEPYHDATTMPIPGLSPPTKRQRAASKK